MLVVVDVPLDRLTPRDAAGVLKGLVEWQATQNELLLGALPQMYQSGVVFRNEPNAGRYETVVSAPLVYRRGWGDCAHLCAWRIAELRLEGIPASAKVYWKSSGKSRLYHVEVRLPDGTVEDPSRYLGML